MLVTTTVLFTVLYLGTRGSVLLAMLFHAGMNAAPEVLLLAPFAGADLQRALTLNWVGWIATALVATAVAWPALTRARLPLAPPAPAAAPAAA
jgi:hypothetical protein